MPSVFIWNAPRDSGPRSAPIGAFFSRQVAIAGCQSPESSWKSGEIDRKKETKIDKEKECEKESQSVKNNHFKTFALFVTLYLDSKGKHGGGKKKRKKKKRKQIKEKESNSYSGRVYRLSGCRGFSNGYWSEV